MSEEKEIEKQTEDSGEGNKPSANGLIDNANAAAERLEAANAKQEELLKRQEEITAKQMLGGTATAGQTPVKKTDDEKWADDAKERYAGTGLDPMPDDTPTTYG